MGSRSRIVAEKSTPLVLGILCGAGAALFWAAGFVAARHGVAIGYTPADLALLRFGWVGVLLLPLIWREGTGNFDSIGWRKGIILTFFGGPPLAIISYAGFFTVPLGHGGVIQPSSAALFGLLYAAVVLRERLPAERVWGAAIIVGGLAVIGFEALATIGRHGLFGDLAFVAAGLWFATFAMFLKRWHISPMRATVIVSVISLADIPIHGVLFGFAQMASFGWWETLLQAATQGALAGAGAIYLFARAVVLLGAARAAVFTSLVPGFTLLIGFLVLGEIPSRWQLVGLAIVLVGFRMTQRG